MNPSEDPKTIHLLIAGNKDVADGLLIVLLSYLAYNSRPVHVHFLSMDLAEKNPRYVPLSDGQIRYLNSLVKEKNPASEVEEVDCTALFQKMFSSTENGMKSSYTPYMLLRLLADEIPSLPDKILYLDTDIFVMKDISSLYDLDLEDYEFAAAPDYLGTFWIKADYQNSGVLLLNLKRIRETGLFRKCRERIVRKNSILLDQDALNKCVLKKKFLPYKYNEQHKENAETVIRHFSKTIRFFPFFHTQNVKPWDVERVHKVLKTNAFDDVLNDYLKRKDAFRKL